MTDNMSPEQLPQQPGKQDFKTRVGDIRNRFSEFKAKFGGGQDTNPGEPKINRKASRTHGLVPALAEGGLFEPGANEPTRQDILTTIAHPKTPQRKHGREERGSISAPPAETPVMRPHSPGRNRLWRAAEVVAGAALIGSAGIGIVKNNLGIGNSGNEKNEGVMSPSELDKFRADSEKAKHTLHLTDLAGDSVVARIGDKHTADPRTPEATKAQEPTVTKAPEPTPAPLAAPEGTHGKYKTIREIPNLTESDIKTIEAMTTGTRIQIITPDGNIIAIDERMYQDGPRIIKNFFGSTVTGEKLTSVTLNTTDFPDAAGRLDTAIQTARWEAWKGYSGKDLSFEAYLDGVRTNPNAYSFPTRSKDINSEKYGEDHLVNPGKPVVIIVTYDNLNPDTPNGTSTIESTTSSGFDLIDNGRGLGGIRIFDVAPGDAANNSPRTLYPSRYHFATGLAWALVLSWEDPKNLTLKDPAGNISGRGPAFMDADKRIKDVLVPIQTDAEWNSIFRVTAAEPQK